MSQIIPRCLDLITSEQVIAAVRSYQPNRIVHRKSLTTGLVVGTYAALPYVHLQLESLRRFHPNMPCLVVDDASPQSSDLRRLCASYGAEFVVAAQRRGHIPGDIAAFVRGHQWAKEQGIRWLVKFSRRWIPMVRWSDDLEELAERTGAPTLCSRCEFHHFGFRSECVAMDVGAWTKSVALDHLQHKVTESLSVSPHLTADDQHRFLVEGIIHHAAMLAAAKADPKWREFEQNKAGCGHYVQWPMMGLSRRHPRHDVLWHEWTKPEDYRAQLAKWGISYPSEAMKDASANLR